MPGSPLQLFVALYVGEGSERGQCCYLTAGGLLDIPPTSSHYVTGAPLAVALVVIPRVGGVAYILGSYQPFKWTLLRDPQFLPLAQPQLVFTARSYEALFPWHWNPELHAVTWGSLPRYLQYGTACTAGCCHWLPPSPPCSSHLAATTQCLFCPSYLSLPLLPIWMNIPSLHPWCQPFI